MKEPSKLDQLRALREGAHQPRREVVPDIHKPKSVKAKPPVVKATADQPGAVPWLAPEGECASCDKRRAALNATMRKRRERGTT